MKINLKNKCINQRKKEKKNRNAKSLFVILMVRDNVISKNICLFIVTEGGTAGGDGYAGYAIKLWGAA